MKLIKYFFLFSTIIILMQAITFSVSASTSDLPRVIDNAGLISAEEESELAKLISEFSKNQNLDLVILTENTINVRAEEYADDYYDYNGYGIGNKHDGILALYVKNYRMNKGYFHISTTGKAISLYNDSNIERLLDTVEPYIKSKSYGSAFSAFIEKADAIAHSTKNIHLIIKISVSALVGIITAFIVTGCMRKKLNSARPNRYANVYADKDSLILTRDRDIFLRNTITKVKIPQSSGSSSTHTSSSGTNHGGGGRSM